MQVSTSTSRRRAPWCIIGSAEATSGRPSSAASRGGAGDARRRPGRRSAGSATRWAWRCAPGEAAGAAAARRAGRGRAAGAAAGAGRRARRGRRRGAGTCPSRSRRAPSGQQAAEPGPAGAVARQRGDLEPLGEAEPGGGDEARHGGAVAGRLAQLLVGADEAGDRVAVGDGEGGQAELDRAERVLLRVAAPGQEGEVRGDRELGEGHGRGSASSAAASGEPFPDPRIAPATGAQGSESGPACYGCGKPTAKEDSR